MAGGSGGKSRWKRVNPCEKHFVPKSVGECQRNLSESFWAKECVKMYINYLMAKGNSGVELESFF